MIYGLQHSAVQAELVLNEWNDRDNVIKESEVMCDKQKGELDLDDPHPGRAREAIELSQMAPI